MIKMQYLCASFIPRRWKILRLATLKEVAYFLDYGKSTCDSLCGRVQFLLRTEERQVLEEILLAGCGKVL